MEMIFIKNDSPEWAYMWEWIEKHPINSGLSDPALAINSENGEVWQYMGTFKSNDGRAIHEFRHRAHPFNGERMYLKVSASENFSEGDIESRVKVN